jgi:hypothetical protein
MTRPRKPVKPVKAKIKDLGIKLAYRLKEYWASETPASLMRQNLECDAQILRMAFRIIKESKLARKP